VCVWGGEREIEKRRESGARPLRCVCVCVCVCACVCKVALRRCYGVATISRLLKITALFCKRAL